MASESENNRKCVYVEFSCRIQILIFAHPTGTANSDGERTEKLPTLFSHPPALSILFVLISQPIISYGATSIGKNEENAENNQLSDWN